MCQKAFALLAFNSHTRIIADLLFEAREGVEESGLSAIGVSNQCEYHSFTGFGRGRI